MKLFMVITYLAVVVMLLKIILYHIPKALCLMQKLQTGFTGENSYHGSCVYKKKWVRLERNVKA